VLHDREHLPGARGDVHGAADTAALRLCH
jgi:hypothetical protein